MLGSETENIQIEAKGISIDDSPDIVIWANSTQNQYKCFLRIIRLLASIFGCKYTFFFDTDAKKDKVRCKNTEKQQYARVIHLRYCAVYLVGCHVVLYNFGRKGLMGR